MFEAVFAVVLRLFPASFRQRYGEEATLLVRDRARRECGFWARMLLGWDLAWDLVRSLPVAHRNAALMGPVAAAIGGAPRFEMLESSGMDGRLLMWAAVLSLGVFWGFAGLAGAARTRLAAWDYLARQPRAGAAPGVRVPGGRAVAGSGMDDGERRRVVAAVVADVREFYFDKAVGRTAAETISAREAKGEYNGITVPEQLARVLTDQLRAATQSMDVEVVWSEIAIPEVREEPSTAAMAEYKAVLERNHCLLRPVERLAGGVRYLRLDGFADASVCGHTAEETMRELDGAHAVIFDLRENRGGDPAMVMLVAAYLFDHPEYMFSPREAPTEALWTRPPVAGSQLADKRVYLLTSSRTWSAGEQFSYDLKMLRRATLVGETTGGGAHAGVFHRVDEHFGVGIPEARAVNPFGRGDWEGVGVQPDVHVRAEDALPVAETLAARR